MQYRTEQEQFWSGEFGNAYIQRNQGEGEVSSNVALFSEILKSTRDVSSFVELGCNRGMNLEALNRINKEFDLTGYEINQNAADIAQQLNVAKINQGTILDPITTDKQYDLSFTKGVLIHINPDELHHVYENLYSLSKRYIMVCEYYNPSPVTVSYRGEQDRLFKRDFAGELIKKYNLKLVNYGFVYHGDPCFPQDDVTWFLLEK